MNCAIVVAAGTRKREGEGKKRRRSRKKWNRRWSYWRGSRKRRSKESVETKAKE